MIHTGDCLDVMATFDAESIDAIVTDPPYGLEFMGKEWDKFAPGKPRMTATEAADHMTDGSYGPWGRRKRPVAPNDYGRRNEKCLTCGRWRVSSNACKCEKPEWETRARDGAAPSMLALQAFSEAWAREAFRVARPGAYLLAFGGTRTVHRLASAIEDAGWIIRDMLVWAYASGFPKSKASLKPAWEPIVMARKPGPLRMLDIDGCRMPAPDADLNAVQRQADPSTFQGKGGNVQPTYSPLGRWPANVILTDELFEPGVPGVIIAGSLTGTMTAWSLSPDSEPSPTVSSARRAAPRSSRTARGDSSRASATEPVAMPLGVWATSTDTPRPDTGCSSATGSTTIPPTSNSSPEPNTTDTTRPSRPESSGNDAMREPGTSGDWNDASASLRPNSPTVEADGYSRFFLIPKADRADREPVLGGLPTRVVNITEGHGLGPVNTSKGDGTGIRENRARANHHPTVKPTDLMRHLVRLVTPPGGTVLDPFLGSGSTAIACELEGFAWIGIEKEPEYVAIAEARLNGTQRGMGLIG